MSDADLSAQKLANAAEKAFAAECERIAQVIRRVLDPLALYAHAQSRPQWLLHQHATIRVLCEVMNDYMESIEDQRMRAELRAAVITVITKNDVPNSKELH